MGLSKWVEYLLYRRAKKSMVCVVRLSIYMHEDGEIGGWGCYFHGGMNNRDDNLFTHDVTIKYGIQEDFLLPTASGNG